MKITKVISMTVICCMAAAVLSGCGGNKNHGLNPKGPTSITIWHYYNGVQQENFDSFVWEFNETVGQKQGARMVVVKSDEKTEHACVVFLKWFGEKEHSIEFLAGSSLFRA